MNVLTWFGAVLRMDPVRNRLVQDPVWMTKLDGLDFEADGDLVQTPLGQLRVIPGERTGTVRLSISGQYLTAAPANRELSLEPHEGPALQAFLLIRPDDLADVRHILSHAWRAQPGAQVLQKADIRLGPGFNLILRNLQLDLAASLPLASDARPARGRSGNYVPPQSYRMPAGHPGAAFIELADAGAVPSSVSAEIELFARRSDPTAALAEGESLESATNAHLVLDDPNDAQLPAPVVITANDQALFGSRPQESRACRVRRELARYVCLCPGAEGMVFDTDGVSTDMSLLIEAERLPTGFHRRDGRLWLDRALMDSAPRLGGTHLVFFGSGLDDFDTWMAGAMPALDVLVRNAPRHVRVLLPTGMGNVRGAPMAFNHREVMATSGYSHLQIVESAAPVILAEDLIYLDSPKPAGLPRALLDRFRVRVLQQYEGPGEPVRRIYLRSAQITPGVDAMERFLLQQSFEPVQLNHIPVAQQIELFRSAAFVVGEHGMGLSNILFAPPGLRVLELMDAAAFQSDIWHLAGKLGHLHGFLGRVAGDVDADCFRDLFAAMEAFRV